MELRQILDGVESLEMVMPEFQREYVWPIEDAKQLLVSMYRDYPTGCLLFWETENPPEIKNKAVDTSKLGLTKVILDGQQRLTTLYLLIKGEIPPYYTQEDILQDPRHLFFNVLSGDFQFYQKSMMETNPLWCSVTSCFDENQVDGFDIAESYCTTNPSEDFRSISKSITKNLTQLRGINKMIYPILTVPKSATIDGAIDVFDRVNSLGTKLTDAELVLTHITGGWPQARRVMKDKMHKMKNIGFDFGLDFLTRCIVITLTKSALYNKNAKLKYELFTSQDYQDAWTKVSKALDYLIPILQQDALISTTNDLSTNNSLVPIVGYLVENNNRFTGSIKYHFLYWMFLANIWSRYSGQTDARLDKDIYILNNSENIVADLVQEIEDNRGRLEVKEADMEGRTAGHPLYKMLYVITKAQKAIDWSNGGSIYGTIGDYYSIQSHHIFPQAFLYRNGFQSDNHIDKKKVNEIANRAFITRDSNYSIKDKSPADYLPTVKSEYPDALTKQFIPDEPKLWNAENFDDFLLARRNWIAKEINDFLLKLKNHSPDSNDVLEPKQIRNWVEYFKNEENNFIEYKSSLRVCLKENKPMQYVEHSILKTINGFQNSEGGTLYIGIEDDGNILGLDRDFLSFGPKGKDGFLLHFDNMIINGLGKEQQADVSIKFEAVDGKEFGIVEVSASNKPVFLTANGKKEFYVRHAASSRAYDISEAYEYISKHWS